MLDVRRLNRYYEMIFSTELDENSIDRILRAMSDFNAVGSDSVSTGFISGYYGDVQIAAPAELLKDNVKLAGFMAGQGNHHKMKQVYVDFSSIDVPNIAVPLVSLFLQNRYSLDQISVTFKPDKNPHKIFHFDLSSVSSIEDLAGHLADRTDYFSDRYAYIDFDFSRKGAEPLSFRIYRVDNGCYVAGFVPPDFMRNLLDYYIKSLEDDHHSQGVL